MIDNDLIQVLWVEDDPKVREAYTNKAEFFGLQLVSFPCWDDAKLALENDYDIWSAIILDAKCKHHRDSADNAVRFLGEALKDIAVMSKEKRWVIPWYVLTGGAESEVSDSITEDRMKWDADWTNNSKKKYYSKNSDDEELYKRIREQSKKSPRLQLRELYYDCYETLAKLNKRASEIILNIFEAMHYPDEHPDFDPVLYYNQLRQILEWNFRNAREYAIIPEMCFTNNMVNLSQCCIYLCGRNATATETHFRFGEYRNKNDYDRIVPPYIENMMFLILNLGNIHSHTSQLSDNEQQELGNFIKNNVINSRYLIFSLALQVCEITLWMSKYVEVHRDVQKNKAMLKIIDNTEQDSNNQEKEIKNNIHTVNISEENDKTQSTQSKKLEDGLYYEGIIVETRNSYGTFLNVKCDLYPFPLPIKNKKKNTTKDCAVRFKAVQEPNRKESSKAFWVADDVHLM